MARTEIDGDQVQDETLTGSDVLDGSIESNDVNINSLYEALPSRPTFSYCEVDGSKDDIDVISTQQMIVTKRLKITNTGNIKVSGRLTINKG